LAAGGPIPVVAAALVSASGRLGSVASLVTQRATRDVLIVHTTSGPPEFG